MKRWLILILGLIMVTTLTGCTLKSRATIQDEFLDYLSLLPLRDLTDLYNYDGRGKRVSEGIGSEGTGVWGLGNALLYSIGDDLFSQHIVLWFNRNTREARGFYYDAVNDVKEKYPIYYDATGIHLENEVDVEKVGEKLDKIVFLFQYLDLDKEYLNSLEVKSGGHTSGVPSSTMSYHLGADDKYLKKTLKLYPQLQEQMKNPMLMLESVGRPWNSHSHVQVSIHMGELNSISSSLFFTNQEKYEEAVGD